MDVTESYRILELEIGASRAAVDAAYCRLVEKWHPDRAASDSPEAIREAQRMVQLINDAYHTIAKISPQSVKPLEPLPAKNPERRSPSRTATASKSSNPPAESATPAAPKTKPKLPPLVGGQPSLSGSPPPAPPPSPETWAARGASSSAPVPPPPPPPAPPPASPPPAAAIPVAPISPPPKPPPPPPPAFRPPAVDKAPVVPPSSSVAPAPENPPGSASPASDPRKLPGLYDSLFPVDSPLRRFGPVILIAVVVLVFVLGKCAVSSSKSKSARGPDPKTTGRIVAKSNVNDVTLTVTRLAEAGDVTSANFSGTVDQPISGIPPGKYVVTGHAAAWSDVRNEVTVEAEHTTDVMLNFKGGSLRLDSVPTGATVRLGAEVLGRTPLVVPNLPPGSCQLSLEFPSWPLVQIKTAITEGRESVENVRLPHGKLIVETVPPGTTVSLGKKVLGQTPLTLEQFPAGTRKVVLQARDFPPLEVPVTMDDHGEVKLHPALGSVFPMLDPAALMRSIWVPDNPDQIAPPLEGVTGPFQSKNGVVKNLNRKRLFEVWMNRRYRFTGTIKSYDKENAKIEFVEQPNDLSKYKIVAALSNDARNDSDLVAQLVKGTNLTLYGRLTAVEEPRWPSKVITFEFSSSDPLR